MNQVFLGLGSNQGDRKKLLSQAVHAIARIRNSRVCRFSSVYETEPWGRRDQDTFLNQVIELETGLEPNELLAVCQNIEKSLGRKKETRWGSRTMDIDLLLFGGRTINDQILQIPHPRLRERRFVLVPLAEIAPDYTIPGSKKTVQELLEECRDMGSVVLYKDDG